MSSTCSWVLCWWIKSARAAGTSRSSGLSLRICLLVKSTSGEQESKYLMNVKSEDLPNYCYRHKRLEEERDVLQEGRGFTALGLMKILGMNGVLLLSTFSLNFSWGLAIFLACSSRNISERLPEPEPWSIKALFTTRCEAAVWMFIKCSKKETVWCFKRLNAKTCT